MRRQEARDDHHAIRRGEADRHGVRGRRDDSERFGYPVRGGAHGASRRPGRVRAKQYRNEYVFLTPNKYAQDYITVVAPADASVTLDGNLIPAGNFQTMTNGQWKVARMAVTDGVHRIVGNKPVGVVVYGYDRDVSYGYAGGLNLSDE